MTPEEKAVEMLDWAKRGWIVLFSDNDNLTNFVRQTALNDADQIKRQRSEIFKLTDPEYQAEYWDAVKTHIKSL